MNCKVLIDGSYIFTELYSSLKAIENFEGNPQNPCDKLFTIFSGILKELFWMKNILNIYFLFDNDFEFFISKFSNFLCRVIDLDKVEFLLNKSSSSTNEILNEILISSNNEEIFYFITNNHEYSELINKSRSKGNRIYGVDIRSTLSNKLIQSYDAIDKINIYSCFDIDLNSKYSQIDFEQKNSLLKKTCSEYEELNEFIPMYHVYDGRTYFTI